MLCTFFKNSLCRCGVDLWSFWYAAVTRVSGRYACSVLTCHDKPCKDTDHVVDINCAVILHQIPLSKQQTRNRSVRWRRSAVGRVSDLRSRGRGFDSRPGTRRKNCGQVSHTYVPLSPSSISWYWPKGDDALRLGSKGRYGSCVGGR